MKLFVFPVHAFYKKVKLEKKKRFKTNAICSIKNNSSVSNIAFLQSYTI